MKSFLHIGIPCSWWSSLAKINGSSRTKQAPDGIVPLLPQEIASSAQACRVAILCTAQHLVGGLVFGRKSSRKFGFFLLSFSAYGCHGPPCKHCV